MWEKSALLVLNESVLSLHYFVFKLAVIQFPSNLIDINTAYFIMIMRLKL